MDSHLQAMAQLLGQPVPDYKFPWVRGSLFGLNSRAVVLWALCGDVDNPAELTHLDYHEMAHTLITTLAGTDHVPPFVLIEGWAESPHGSEALFALSFLESSIFPIPPDVLLIALCLGDPSRSMFFAFICSAASVLGGMAGYGIGVWGGRPVLNRMFAAERIAVVKRFYDRWNAWATGIAGLTPLPYKIFTIAGGAFGVNFKIFVIASILASSHF